MIPNQVKLPKSVAFGVVIQGIRIRFGRSLVTVMGVVFGIAFLMSVLTTQALKKGVTAEDRLRSEVQRMFNFLRVEMGPGKGRTIGVIAVGPLSESESRLLTFLESCGLARLRAAVLKPGIVWPEFAHLETERVAAGEAGRDASAILLMGSGDLPHVDWGNLLQSMRQRVIGITRPDISVLADGATVVRLTQALRPSEIEKREQQERRTRFRNTWILIVSLLVTVMGISNAMLMSVTERFREIGTMKCLGALSAFVRVMFLIESALVGIVGAAAGCLVGVVFSLVAYGFTYGFGLTLMALRTQWVPLLGYLAASFVAGIVLSVMAAIYPANVASNMIPANALRSNV